MADLNLSGLGVALITPFKKDFSIDFESLNNVIEHVIKGGCDYIVALGTTAETPTLSFSERVEIATQIKRTVNNRIPLVIGIGGNCTARVIENINNFNLEGFSAILSVTPFYNKPSQEGLFKHYEAIVKASPIPLILYNVPGRTGINLSAETTIRLSKFSNKIYGLKDASGCLEQSEKILKATPNDFLLISGDDASVVPLMEKGAKGVISVVANAYPKVMKQMVDLCNSGKYNEANKKQDELLPFINLLFKEGNPSGVKAVLKHLGLIENNLRLPLVTVSSELEQKLCLESEKILGNS